MFDKGAIDYKSDIELGKKYHDPQTGIEGTATSVHFYQYACERVIIEYVKPDRTVEELSFDAPRLESIETGVRAKSERTGGPGRTSARPSIPSR
jgi:hypothetical protein